MGRRLLRVMGLGPCVPLVSSLDHDRWEQAQRPLLPGGGTFGPPVIDGSGKPSPAIGVDCRTARQPDHRVREELESDFAGVGSAEFIEEGSDALGGETPVVGRKLMDRKEEMRRQEEDPVLLQATVQFAQGQPRILHVLDGVDEQRGTDGPITDAQAVEIVKLIDTEPRTHITPTEGAAWKQRTYGGQVGLAGDPRRSKLEDRLWQLVCIAEPLEQIVDDCPHSACLSESHLNSPAVRRDQWSEWVAITLGRPIQKEESQK